MGANGEAETGRPRRDAKGFADLAAWQCAMELAESIYEITRSFPSDERFGLTAQIRRAAVSVPSNIAEGYGRESTPDFLRHLRIARGSLCEVQTQLHLAVALGFTPQSGPAFELLDRTARIVQGLIRSLEARQSLA